MHGVPFLVDGEFGDHGGYAMVELHQDSHGPGRVTLVGFDEVADVYETLVKFVEGSDVEVGNVYFGIRRADHVSSGIDVRSEGAEVSQRIECHQMSATITYTRRNIHYDIQGDTLRMRRSSQ